MELMPYTTGIVPERSASLEILMEALDPIRDSILRILSSCDRLDVARVAPAAK